MAHNPRILMPGTLPAHYVIAPGQLSELDRLAAESLDGTNGGTYNPETPIAFGGQGLLLQGSSRIQGHVRTGVDAVGLTLAADVYPTFTTPRTRTVVIPLHPFSDSDGLILKQYEHVFSPLYGIKSTASQQKVLYFGLPSLRLHHGATIVRAKLRWRSGAQPVSLSGGSDAINVPWARLIRVKKEGVDAVNDYAPTNLIELFNAPVRPAGAATWAVDDVVRVTNFGGQQRTLRCLVGGAQAPVGINPNPGNIGDTIVDNAVTWRVEYGFNNPFFHYNIPPIPNAADKAVYHNDGLPQDILIRCNQNTTIDTVNYDYRLEFLDPGGSGGVSYGHIYHSLFVELSNITSLKEP